MAERPNVKDILAAARRGGAAKPADEAQAEAPAPAPEEQAAPPAAEETTVVAAAPAAAATPAAPLGRPMTLKEKLAAARSGGAATPGATPAAKPAAAAPAEVEIPAATTEEVAAPAAPKAPAAPLGRPLTMAEKLAAARGGGAPAAAAGAAKPAAAKPAAAAAAKAAPASTRELPPLDKITDPRDLAEALRRAGADKEKVAKTEAAAKAAEAAGATPGAAAAAAKASAAKKLESKVVPPKPSKDAATAAATATAGAPAGSRIARRPFLRGLGWIIAGWAAFAAGMGTLAAACGRFLFPNVLAEPPSTVKVGLPSQFEPEQVNETWKAEWGFWIVRSANYDGEDKIYAIQSVCTHLGCPPNWLAAEAKFKCPCHGSGFYVSGVNFEGPAPRPLERFKVLLNDAGELIVDKSQKYQEELKQWSDPDSYIVA